MSRNLTYYLEMKNQGRLTTADAAGFHDDDYMLAIVDAIMEGAEAFVETGTCLGLTVSYIAHMYAPVKSYSCELDPELFEEASRRCGHMNNVILYKMKSPDFLYQIHRTHPHLRESFNFYFLDAHDSESRGYECPINEELEFITSQMEGAVIIIDDTRVPDSPEFAFYTYEGQALDHDHVFAALSPGKEYHVFYPSYSEGTSMYHPLVGYVVIVYGNETVAATLQNLEGFDYLEISP